ncbi:MAG TPA: PA14 domain-containing protein [Chitinophagaceae bacterium]|nr:PA14 domain-containing protein [Chitinophagaceae bacterium]
MIKHLLLMLLAFGYVGTQAQNVFNPADPLVTYNSAALPGSSTNPTQPAPGVMAKWVRTARMGWTTTAFKSYIWNGMAFRLRFPNNYNPANKYPVVLFFHGGGETGTIYDNEYQLLWGAQTFEQRINNGEWNGFLLFPQETSVGWDDNYFSRINGVLDTLQKYNNADPDRLIAMGLSSGGYGSVAYASFYPKRVAASLPSSPAQIRTLSGSIPAFLHIPLWMANGGVDVNPDPYNGQGFYQDFRNAGGRIFQTYYVDNNHNTWTDMWNQKNASGTFMTTAYWNTAHKAQPLVYYQNQQFCNAISAKMGITAGYFAYEWQQNGLTIAGATGNEYTATQAGSYRVRFMRTATSGWSDWTPNPVVISAKACAADTLYAEHFNSDNYFVSASGYSIGNFTCQGGIMTSGTNLFTQDATGVEGNRFLIDYTKTGNGCSFAAGDRVWNTYTPVTVQPNTNYEYSFYMANQNATSPAQLAPTINGTPLTASYVQPAGTGNSSWKKYTFTWNSGGFTYADLGIINRSAVTTGNDFAIDEISFKLASAAPVPGCTVNASPANGAQVPGSTNATLSWAAVANAASYDVYIWTGAVAPALPTGNTSSTSYNAINLIANTVYNWYVVPKNSLGMAATGCSNNQTSFTTAPIALPPACVSNSTPANGSTVASSNAATLGWTAAATATSYDVYLWTGANPPATATATVTTTSYNATGLTATTLYNFYVVPRNAAGTATGCNSNTSSFTTAAAPTVPNCVSNTAPANGSTLASSNTATLGWTAAATATSYDVYLWTGASAPAVPTANVTATSYNASGLLPASQYKFYIVPKNAVGAAVGCSANVSSFTTATAPIVGTGTGLKGDYYNTVGLTGAIYLSRTDATVNFDWGNGSPYVLIGGNTFSARWTGYVQPLYSETYTFYTNSDDGVRLWVNGQLLVNNWTAHSALENSGTITLTAGVKYDIKIEYFENTGSAVMKLYWSSASTAKAIVPQKQLYLPGAGGAGNRVADVAAVELAAPVVTAPLVNSTAPSVQTGVYPNPVAAGQNTTLLLNSPAGGAASVEVISAMGNTLQRQQLQLAAGGNNRTLQTAALLPGLYILHITGAVDKTSALKLIIR